MENINQIRIGFIGAGKVGCSLGRYIAEKGGTLSGYYSRRDSSAKDAADFTGSRTFASAAELMESSDIIFVTVPDDSIRAVWRGLAEQNPSDAPSLCFSKLFCHCSGSLTSAVFEGAAELGALACSLHPLLAVSDRKTSWKSLLGASITFEGSDAAFGRISPLIDLMGNKTGRIEPDKKILYHAACVFFSNLAVGLAGCGVSLFEACGLESDFADTAWHALFTGNSENIVSKGMTGALTGPVERGDAQTIMSHIQTLGEIDAQRRSTADNASVIYRELSKVLVKIAAEKNPDRDYANLAFLE
jgi:predicted short-subunit dehydrogenase-like oxidoreductase (DUF2520 family)